MSASPPQHLLPSWRRQQQQWLYVFVHPLGEDLVSQPEAISIATPTIEGNNRQDCERVVDSREASVAVHAPIKSQRSNSMPALDRTFLARQARVRNDSGHLKLEHVLDAAINVTPGVSTGLSSVRRFFCGKAAALDDAPAPAPPSLPPSPHEISSTEGVSASMGDLAEDGISGRKRVCTEQIR